MSLNLSQTELIEITGKQRPKAQRLALARMGIDFLVRPDGKPIVSHQAYERALGIFSDNQALEQTPNYDAIFNGS